MSHPEGLYGLPQHRRTQTYIWAGFESATPVLRLFKAALASYLATTVISITYFFKWRKNKKVTLRVSFPPSDARLATGFFWILIKSHIHSHAYPHSGCESRCTFNLDNTVRSRYNGISRDLNIFRFMQFSVLLVLYMSKRHLILLMWYGICLTNTDSNKLQCVQRKFSTL
jgi:hypothetical protein